nr:dihydrolipoamide acetyltransferase [Archangium violaceum]
MWRAARVLAVAFTAMWAPAFGQQGPSAVPTPAPTEAAPPAAPAQAPAASQARTADEAFNTRVRTLEEQVVDLKEKIYRSKARLQLLQETVLGGELSTGARAVLVHRNEMGDSFVLESVVYALDGAPIYTRTDETEELSKSREFEIFSGRLVPGQHQVAVRLVYRGHGFGVFSYLEGYRFKVQSSYTFNAEPGKVTTVRVVGFEKGGVTTDLQDRPAVRYDIESSREPEKPKPTPDAAPPPPAAASESK